MEGKWRTLNAWIKSLNHKRDLKGPQVNKVMCEECNVNVMSMQLAVSSKRGRNDNIF